MFRTDTRKVSVQSKIIKYTLFSFQCTHNPPHKNTMNKTLPDVAQALLGLSSFAKRNPNVSCGYTAEELDDLCEAVMQILRNKKYD